MKDFTFIFMLYNLDGLGGFGLSKNDEMHKEVVSQLERLEIPEKANIVMVDHKPDKTKDILRPFKNSIINEVSKREGSLENNINPCFTLGVRNIGDGDSLAGIFLLVKEKFPAHKYVLFTYDHSNFIGHLTSRIVRDKFFKFISEVDKKIAVDDLKLNESYEKFREANTRFEVELIDYVENRVVLPDFRNPENYDMLTNAELSDAIHIAFVLNGPDEDKMKNRVEAVFFDTCYTGAIDNLYLYSKSSKHIVASEGEINYNSYNISRVIKSFCDGDPAKKVVSDLVKNFEADFKSMERLEGANDYKKTILRAFELSKNYRTEFKNLFNSLLLDMMADIDGISKIIKLKITSSGFWEDCYFIYNIKEPDPHKNQFFTHCIDFFSFFQDLEKATEGKTYKPKVTNLLSLVNNCISEKYTGKSVDKEYQGVSLFFNRDISTLDEKKKEQIGYIYSFFSNFQNDFAKDTFWPEFLQLYQKVNSEANKG